MRQRAIVVLLLGVLGCPSPGSDLTVDVQTGLSPGREFGYVVIELAPGSVPTGPLPSPQIVGEEAELDDDAYRTGARIHTFEGLEAGIHTVRVLLRRPAARGGSPDGGQALIDRRLIVSLVADRVIRVPLTSDCLGVECPLPTGSPALTACLNGRCVDPRCDPGDPTTFDLCCDPADCADRALCESASDCEMVASCATPGCAEGVCVTDGTSCSPDEHCAHDTEMCVAPAGPAPDASMPADAASVDASVDAASSDAANIDTSDAPIDRCMGVPCAMGTTCVDGSCLRDPFEVSLGRGIVRGVGLSGDNVVIAAEVDGAVALGGPCDPLPGAGMTDVLIAAFDALGVCVWARRYGGTAADEPRALVVDAAGNLYVVGLVGSAISLGGGTLPYMVGSSDLFVASYRPDGTHRWSFARGGPGFDAAIGVAVDDPDILVTGAFSGPVVFERMLTATMLDAFVVRVAASTGVFVTSANTAGSGLEWGRGIAADDRGNFSTSSARSTWTSTSTAPAGLGRPRRPWGAKTSSSSATRTRTRRAGAGRWAEPGATGVGRWRWIRDLGARGSWPLVASSLAPRRSGSRHAPPRAARTDSSRPTEAPRETPCGTRPSVWRLAQRKMQ